MTNPDNVGGLPDGMVMVQRSDAMRLAMFVEPLLTGGAVQLSAMRIAELCRAAPAGGDVDAQRRLHADIIEWGQRVDAGEISASELWTQVRPSLNTLRRLIRDSAPAGGDYRGVIPQVLEETINGVVSDLEMIAAGKDQVTGDPVSGLQSQRIAKAAHDRLLSAWNACDSAPAGGDVTRRWHIERDGNDLLVCKGYHHRSDGCEFVRYTIAEDSAPAGSGEVEEMAKRLLVEASDVVENTCLHDVLMRAAALLRKLQQGADKPLTADMAKALPGGTIDDTTFDQIEHALDRAGAPACDESGKWLTLSQRIAALASQGQEGV